jgi:hypothetical protein
VVRRSQSCIEASSPLAGLVTLDNLVAPSGLTFLNCEMGTVKWISFIGLLWGLTEVTHVNLSLAHRMHCIHASNYKLFGHHIPSTLKTFLFWNNCRLTRSYKHSPEVPHILPLVASKEPTYTITVHYQPGNSHWHKMVIRPGFLWISSDPTCTCLYSCSSVNFFMYIFQDTKLFSWPQKNNFALPI